MSLCAHFYSLTAVTVYLLFSNHSHGTLRFYIYILPNNKMPKFYVCQLFKDFSIVHLMRNREWKWFRVNSKWKVTYYERNEFFIIA